MINALKASEKDIVDHIMKMLEKNQDKPDKLFDIVGVLIDVEKYELAEIVNEQLMKVTSYTPAVLWQRAEIFFLMGKT